MFCGLWSTACDSHGFWFVVVMFCGSLAFLWFVGVMVVIFSFFLVRIGIVRRSSFVVVGDGIVKTPKAVSRHQLRNRGN
jgi:hypothetical protein